jgi:hypothetical protein
MFSTKLPLSDLLIVEKLIWHVCKVSCLVRFTTAWFLQSALRIKNIIENLTEK